MSDEQSLQRQPDLPRLLVDGGGVVTACSGAISGTSDGARTPAGRETHGGRAVYRRIAGAAFTPRPDRTFRS
jgi:hypothetical protein